MKRHHDRRIGFGIVIINIAHQCDLLEKALESTLTVFLDVTNKVARQLVDVAEAVLIGLLVLSKRCDITGVFHDLFKQIRYRQLLRRSAQLINHIRKRL